MQVSRFYFRFHKSNLSEKLVGKNHLRKGKLMEKITIDSRRSCGEVENASEKQRKAPASRKNII